MDDFTHIDETAKAYFACKVANGKIPSVVIGGEHDGFKYFVTVINEQTWWLTEYGLMPPLTEEDPTHHPSEA